jgi:hypothetical protein
VPKAKEAKDRGGRLLFDKISRTLSSNIPKNFDLSEYMAFELKRGDEDSAKPKFLGFNVKVARLEGSSVRFKLKF